MANVGVAWSTTRGGAYMSTPLVYGDYVYIARWNAVLACHDAETGDLIYEERLGRGGTVSASPVASGGRIYIPTEDGDVYVIRAGPEFEVMAVNSMDEVTLATPAISGDVLYFRTRSHMVAVGE
jgi:outer membrane protein assembly factor BamB